MTAITSAFEHRQGELHAEAVPLRQLAEQFGTPLYVYSRSAVEQKFDAYRRGLGEHPGLICYAVKANSNLAVLDVLARRGAGFDIVSLGELERVLAAGGDPAKVVFSGVAKQAHEMRRALEVGIHCFNVESESELRRLNDVAAELGQRAPVSIRVNPDVDAQTHPYISTGLKRNKFGIAIERAAEVYRNAAQTLPNLELIGVDCHIGSQILNTSPYDDALDRVLALVDTLIADGIPLKHLDLGGGLGVRYTGEDVEPDISAFVASLVKALGNRDLELILEPGRSIVANAGVLLTRVEFLKDNGDHHFAIVDAGMNDQIRPALYQAWMSIEPVVANSDGKLADWDIVGPVCETGDFIGKGRPLSLAEGDLLAVQSAGAYGFVMASNYNSRNRPAEVLVDGDQAQLVRKRETVADQLALESRLS
ncbi:diaminopimelate decarboxylase [Saccharospirillum mangrovi]|uniref:diaminopimelate decarboxylase n=1 Tax=Saccharospirillum mangrovi TaxID=2161747 RepID=UPI000D3C317A|nr:diaminopimelate decarboxylase [Saccharospirillum mangrovi]